MEAWAGALLQPREIQVKSRSTKEITLKKDLLFLLFTFYLDTRHRSGAEQ